MSRTLPGPTYTPGIYRTMPIDEYHAAGAMSSTGLRTASRSMLHYLHQRENPKTSTAFAFGHHVHSRILDKPGERLPSVVSQFDSYRTKDARTWRDEQQAAGITILSQEEAQALDDAVAAVWAHPFASAILHSGAGENEVSYFWDEAGVPCRARPDSLALSANAIVDIKTTRNASAADFRKSCVNFGYHRQSAFYARGLRAHGIDIEAAILICVENAAPYGVAVYHLDAEWLDRGDELALQDLERVRRWLDGQDSTGYPETIQTLSMPGWA